ncbi:MAG: hypothetical protein JST80_12305 [Bdellovibrionales bacterium]|nr:hypothetical protein [Bdellovibrionales bacterium]
MFVFLASCNSPVSVTDTAASLGQTTGGSGTSGNRFVNTGAKAVKVITSKTSLTGSYAVPGILPAVTPIPPTYPGYDGSTTYNPGLSAYQYFDVDGTTVIAKPSWLVDVQLGITSLTASSACATFGGPGALDVQDYYRTSEANCTVAQDGTGAGSDKVFARIVLNRDTTYIGYGENLLVQIEYQAQGLHLNSDGAAAGTVESSLDQLWKVFWNSTLGAASPPKPFAVFVPPNYSACLQSGTLGAGAPGNCTGSYRGAPIRVKQMIIPLSAYPTASVIQLSRVQSRISAAGPYNYVPSFCSADTPLCLGIVIRSITLMRM